MVCQDLGGRSKRPGGLWAARSGRGRRWDARSNLTLQSYPWARYPERALTLNIMPCHPLFHSPLPGCRAAPPIFSLSMSLRANALRWKRQCIGHPKRARCDYWAGSVRASSQLRHLPSNRRPTHRPSLCESPGKAGGLPVLIINLIDIIFWLETSILPHWLRTLLILCLLFWRGRSNPTAVPKLQGNVIFRKVLL